MGTEALRPGLSPRHHLFLQFLPGPSPPQLKNGANNSASFQELHTVAGTKPSYRISYRPLCQVYISNASITVPGTEEVLNKFQYYHCHH